MKPSPTHRSAASAASAASAHDPPAPVAPEEQTPAAAADGTDERTPNIGVNVAQLWARSPTKVLGAIAGDPRLVAPPQAAAAAPGRPRPVAVTQGVPAHDARFEDRGLLGRGATSEVRRVFDPRLNRDIAMKLLRVDTMSRPSTLARFVAEAQTTAQLQHPGILPVYDIGTTADGRVYFTMQEVKGDTLGALIRALHEASRDGDWSSADGGWTLRRLVGVFARVCRAVAYAHQRGVVHRDLKPDNIMVREHGEVLVVDWGLAKVGVGLDHADPDDAVRKSPSSRETAYGTVAGTPLYMAPEQARGDVASIVPATDVYSLGAILYEILTGRPPHVGRTAKEVLSALLAGPPPSLPEREAAAPSSTVDLDGIETLRTRLPIPSDLAVACNRAIRRSPADRYPHAGDLADDVEAWLDGARKRDAALDLVAQADDRSARVAAHRERAAQCRRDGASRLRAVAPWAPEELKVGAWALLDEAAREERSADQLEVECELLLHAALAQSHQLVEAHARLATRYRAEHALAEASRDHAAASRAENRLHAHAVALPAGNAVRNELETYLHGDGWLTITSDPPGAEVALYTYAVRQHKLVATFERVVGVTPLRSVPLGMGSYCATLRLDGYEQVTVPVWVPRQAHVNHTRPGATSTMPVRLARAGEFAADECFVAAGHFVAGGDPLAPGGLERRDVWVDAFHTRRFPVTHGELLVFLNDLVARGDESLALRCVPRERPVGGADYGLMLYRRNRDGTFALDGDGPATAWRLDGPAVMVDCNGAVAYARWLAERSGLPWRLPHEYEWEKAARGVDGRWFPWGDLHDPSRCHMRDSHTGTPSAAPVDACPVDTSPYGVRGMAGNVAEWCANAWSDDGPELRDGAVPPPPFDGPDARMGVNRGGGWYDTAEFTRCAARRPLERSLRRPDVGFRLVRSA